MIAVENLSFGYGGAPLMRDVSFTLPDGCITGVIGPNGSGKTTCLKLCARLLKPGAGRVLVDGKPAEDYAPKAFARTLAFLPQSRPVPMITVRSLVSHGRFAYLGMARRLSPMDTAAVNRALEITGMLDCAGRELRTLSGGQRQKAYLAMLIAQGARHLLLDEPTTYLDIRRQLELDALIRSLRDEGRCVAVVMHDLNQVLRLCDRVLVISEGRLLYQGPSNGLCESGCVERAFGVTPAARDGLRFSLI